MKAGTTIHPNGTKFTHITPYRLEKVAPWGAIPVRQRGYSYGVLIEYKDGVKRFIKNSWYD